MADAGYTRAATRDLKRLDPAVVERIREGIAIFARDGVGDVKKLQDKADLWRLRVGDWRVVFQRGEGSVVVVAVVNRRDSYW